jgi:hypothetical protein
VGLIEHLRREPLSERIQSSPRIDIAFSVEELGVGSVSFSRHVWPLRWKLEARGKERIARLIDETGVSTAVSVDRFNIETPDKRVELTPQDCVSGFAVSPPGALFVAHHRGRRYAVIASAPAQSLTSLSELGIKVTLATPDESPRAIMRLLAFYRNWHIARALGPLGAIRKSAVLEEFEYRIARLACGLTWADRALEFRRHKKVSIDRVQREVGGSPGFASRMKTTDWKWFPDSRQARAAFFNYAQTYKVSGDRKLCDFALRLAFEPASIRLDDPNTGADMFEHLASHQTVVRGAFFAKLVADLNAATVDGPSIGRQS